MDLNARAVLNSAPQLGTSLESEFTWTSLGHQSPSGTRDVRLVQRSRSSTVLFCDSSALRKGSVINAVINPMGTRTQGRVFASRSLTSNASPTPREWLHDAV